MHNRVAELCHSLLNTTDLVAAFDAGIAFVQPEQDENAVYNQASEDNTRTGSTKDQ